MSDTGIWWIFAFVVSYLIGAINPATLLARARGIDLKSSGSGNPGATNASRVMGRRIGIYVLIFDLLKGFLPALLFTIYVGPAAGAFAGFAAILGHMTSPFLGFHGGKGVATTLGVLLAVEPWWLIPVLATFAIVFLLSHRTGIASVGGAVALLGASVLDHNNGEVSILGVCIAILVIIKHRRNIAEAWRDWRSKPNPNPNTRPGPS